MSVFFINPFLGAVGGDFESIATVTVGSGGAANVEFTSIPSTYQHLQIRLVARSTDTADVERFLRLRFNGVSTTTYAFHELYGDGTGAAASGDSSRNLTSAGEIVASGSSTPAQMFGVALIDVLDYSSTSKATTLRSFSGAERNASGSDVYLVSGLWTSTNAVTDVRLFPSAGNFSEHSTFALYGVKAP